MPQPIQSGTPVTVISDGGDSELQPLVGQTGTVEQTNLVSADVRMGTTGDIEQQIPLSALEAHPTP